MKQLRSRMRNRNNDDAHAELDRRGYEVKWSETFKNGRYVEGLKIKKKGKSSGSKKKKSSSWSF